MSRAGKSTLANKLATEFNLSGYNVVIIDQDDYVLNQEQIPLIKNKTDWETPLSMDWPRLKTAITNNLIEYDIVILEGIFCFYDCEITTMMDLKIFLKISYRLFEERKKKDLRWDNTPVPSWYRRHIWQSYKSYGIPEEMNDVLLLCDNAQSSPYLKALIEHITLNLENKS